MVSDGSPIVFVVDDDASVRRALKRLLKSHGFRTETFRSATEFLQHDLPDGPACVVADVKMPGLTGLELQEKLVSTDTGLPIIFITGYGDIPTSVKAMKAGALDFLTKPFESADLVNAIKKAIDQNARDSRKRAQLLDIHKRMETLTPREHEVFALVVTGMLNKQIAAELGASEKTIKLHRARVMSKMHAESLAELVKLSEKAGISPLDT